MKPFRLLFPSEAQCAMKRLIFTIAAVLLFASSADASIRSRLAARRGGCSSGGCQAAPAKPTEAAKPATGTGATFGLTSVQGCANGQCPAPSRTLRIFRR